MSNRKILIYVFAAMVFASCGKTSSQSGVKRQPNGGWEKILTCDEGAVTVDINTIDRPELQVVIRNQAIIKYLSQDIEWAFNHSSAWRLLKAGQPSPAKDADEMILDGRIPQVIFQPNQFQKVDAYINNSMLFSAYRQGNGLSVLFRKVGGWSCSNGGYYTYDACIAAGESWTHEDEIEYGNWHFQRCQ